MSTIIVGVLKISATRRLFLGWNSPFFGISVPSVLPRSQMAWIRSLLLLCLEIWQQSSLLEWWSSRSCKQGEKGERRLPGFSYAVIS